MADRKALVIDAGKVRQSTTGDIVVVPGLKDTVLTNTKIICAGVGGELVDGPTNNSSNWNTAYGWGDWRHTTLAGYGITDACPLSHKTTEDALNGLVKCNGAGSYSATVDYSANWVNNYNYLINGGFDFFQRTTPGTLYGIVNDAYGPDRWNLLTSGSTIQTKRVTGASYSLNAGEISQPNVTAYRIGMEQIIETGSSVPLRGRTVIFQAMIKCSSNQAIRYAILEWTGTADSVTSNVVRDWSSNTYTANNFFLTSSLTITATDHTTPSANTWTQISLTGTVSASCNNLIVFIWTEGTAAQNVTLDVTEAGLYAGIQVRNWEPRSVGEELLLCQRFYEKSYPLDTPPGTVTLDGCEFHFSMGTTDPCAPTVHYLANKRIIVTPTLYSTRGSAATGKVSYDATSDKGIAAVNLGVHSFNFWSGGDSWTAIGHTLSFQYTADAEL